VNVLELLIAVAFMVGVIGFVSLFALFAIWMERKVSAHMQDRLGPMETGGWHGWSQTIADTVKLLLKEDIIPTAVDQPLFRMAPYIVFTGALASFAVIPFAANLIGADLNIGVYYLVAVSSLVVIGILMAGWASNNKWALYGAMRSAAQMVSYEIPVVLSLLVPVLLAQSLSMQKLVEIQAGGFWHWTVFSHLPFALVAFVIYFWASLAEVNRTPFDIPEAESELVAGYHVEYSGMRFRCRSWNCQPKSVGSGVPWLERPGSWLRRPFWCLSRCGSAGRCRGSASISLCVSAGRSSCRSRLQMCCWCHCGWR